MDGVYGSIGGDRGFPEVLHQDPRVFEEKNEVTEAIGE